LRVPVDLAGAAFGAASFFGAAGFLAAGFLAGFAAGFDSTGAGAASTTGAGAASTAGASTLYGASGAASTTGAGAASLAPNSFLISPSILKSLLRFLFSTVLQVMCYLRVNPISFYAQRPFFEQSVWYHNWNNNENSCCSIVFYLHVLDLYETVRHSYHSEILPLSCFENRHVLPLAYCV
jgi:hypothetical protein